MGCGASPQRAVRLSAEMQHRGNRREAREQPGRAIRGQWLIRMLHGEHGCRSDLRQEAARHRQIAFAGVIVEAEDAVAPPEARRISRLIAASVAPEEMPTSIPSPVAERRAISFASAASTDYAVEQVGMQVTRDEAGANALDGVRGRLAARDDRRSDGPDGIDLQIGHAVSGTAQRR